MKVWACFIASTVDQVDLLSLAKIVATEAAARKWVAEAPENGYGSSRQYESYEIESGPQSLPDIEVQCKCGWRGKQSELGLSRGWDKYCCPICEASFGPYPKASRRLP